MAPGGAPAAAGLAGAAARALPAFFEFAAPRDWKAIDFISDLHLCEALPRTFDAWAAHLRHTPADAVFILGDLFEVWVGDDARTLPFERRCVDVLAEAASHRSLAFMAGNRDFLLGAAMLRATGMMGLPDPTVLDAWGQRVLLSHGDALCLDDRPYQAFRAEVRSPAWQQQLPGQAAAAAPGGGGRDPQRQRARGAASTATPRSTSTPPKPCAGCTPWARPNWCTATRTGPAATSWRPASSATCSATGTWTRAERAEVLRLTRSGFERVAPAAP